MTEKPILFSAPMVRAILDGTKTQTRRVITNLKGIGKVTEFGISDTEGYDFHFRNKRTLWNDVDKEYVLSRSPYGKPGDHLWAREGFCYCDELMGDYSLDEPRTVGYRVDREVRTIPDIGCDLSCPVDTYAWNWEHESIRWRPSIHMPRWASRILLLVTDIRVERVQEITRVDALAEGIQVLPLQDENDPSAWYQSGPGQHQARTPTESFFHLWDSINAKRGYSWESNPWCWAVTFERIQ